MLIQEYLDTKKKKKTSKNMLRMYMPQCKLQQKNFLHHSGTIILVPTAIPRTNNLHFNKSIVDTLMCKDPN